MNDKTTRVKQGIEFVPGSTDGVAPSMPAPISSERIDVDGRYWAADVARILFGRRLDWFYRHRARLEREEFFPQPISQIGRPRWSGSSLISWQSREQRLIPRVNPGSGSPEPRPADTLSNVVSFDQVLRVRAREVAKKRRRE